MKKLCNVVFFLKFQCNKLLLHLKSENLRRFANGVAQFFAQLSWYKNSEFEGKQILRNRKQPTISEMMYLFDRFFFISEIFFVFNGS